MALYLGTEKIAPIIHAGTNCKTGVVTSDNNGIVTFPALNFTPNIITVWNIDQVDNDGDVPYLYQGVMLMAVNNKGYWISQCVADNSGTVYLSNASAEGGTGEAFPDAPASSISINGNIYSYYLTRGNNADLSNTEFNYAIYG